MIENKPRYVIVSGFSGVGKGYVLSYLMDKHKADYGLSVSATTRDIREGEVPGVSYHYKTEAEFMKMVEEDRMVEWAGFSGSRYGTMKDLTEAIMAEGKDCILEIEVQGAMIVKEKYPDAIMIYILPPDALTWVRRLEDRGTETPERIARRKKQAVTEARRVKEYEYVLLNEQGKGDFCAEELHRIIQGVHKGEPVAEYLVENNLEFIERISREVTAVVEGE